MSSKAAAHPNKREWPKSATIWSTLGVDDRLKGAATLSGVEDRLRSGTPWRTGTMATLEDPL